MPRTSPIPLHPQHPTTVRPRSSGSMNLLAAVLLLVGAGVAPAAVHAQASFHNTDPLRPLRLEDAFAIPRYALDVHVVPAWQGAGDGAAVWRVRPGVSYGLLPRTQLDIAVPVTLSGETGESTGFGALSVGAQYTFNVERRALPAVALDLSMLVPVGALADAHPGVKALATKTFRWGRLSANSETLFGNEPAGSVASRDLARWATAVGVDRIFARRAMLLGVDLLARQPLDSTLPVQWSAALGGRLQLTPTIAIDAGVSRSLGSAAPDAWGATFALSRVVPVSALLPGFGRWGRR